VLQPEQCTITKRFQKHCKIQLITINMRKKNVQNTGFQN